MEQAATAGGSGQVPRGGDVVGGDVLLVLVMLLLGQPAGILHDKQS
jgi:hypothetical protein